jgi:hypothetical protein
MNSGTMYKLFGMKSIGVINAFTKEFVFVKGSWYALGSSKNLTVWGRNELQKIGLINATLMLK